MHSSKTHISTDTDFDDTADTDFVVIILVWCANKGGIKATAFLATLYV